MGPKKLYKSNTDKMICGVCGGIGEYFRVDPTLIRLLWVFMGLILPGIILYIIAAIIIPSR